MTAKGKEPEKETHEANVKVEVEMRRETIDKFYVTLPAAGTRACITFVNGVFFETDYNLRGKYTEEEWRDLGVITHIINHMKEKINAERKKTGREVRDKTRLEQLKESIEKSEQSWMKNTNRRSGMLPMDGTPNKA